MIVGMGVDIVEIGRLREAISRQGEKFVRRIYTPSEQEYCQARRDPVPHYAARFAAKEALFKALGTGWAKGVTWRDVEVRREAGGPPTLALYGESDRLSKAMGGSAVHLSLSHSEHWAIAVVILENLGVTS